MTDGQKKDDFESSPNDNTDEKFRNQKRLEDRNTQEAPSGSFQMVQNGANDDGFVGNDNGKNERGEKRETNGHEEGKIRLKKKSVESVIVPQQVLSSLVALGDQAGVLTIWGSHSSRPLYVFRDIVKGN